MPVPRDVLVARVAARATAVQAAYDAEGAPERSHVVRAVEIT